MNIQIPDIKPSLIEEYLFSNIKTVFENYEDGKKKSSITVNELKEISRNLSKAIKTLRTAKIYINTLIFRFSLAKDNLNLYDFFILETINFIFKDKYNEIYTYGEYFSVSNVKSLPKDTSEKYKEFFDEKLDNINLFRYLCEKVFDFTKFNKELNSYSKIDNASYCVYNRLEEIRAKDPLFFDLYFTLWDSKYINKSKELYKYFNNIDKNFQIKLSNLFDNSDPTEQKIVLENLLFYIEKYIETVKVLEILEDLYSLRLTISDDDLIERKLLNVIGVVLIKVYKIDKKTTVNIVKEWDDFVFVGKLHNILDYVNFNNDRKEIDHNLLERIKKLLSNLINNQLIKQYCESNKNILNEVSSSHHNKKEALEIFLDHIDKRKCSSYFDNIFDSDSRAVLKLFNMLSFNTGRENNLILKWMYIEESFDIDKIEQRINKLKKLRLKLSSQEKELIRLYWNCKNKFQQKSNVQ